MCRSVRYFIFFLIFILGCKEQKHSLFERKDPIVTGIDFSNSLEPTARLNILNYLYYYNGAGVAASDFNNDGRIDLYFVGNQSEDKLYLNLGNWAFKDITSLSGIKNESGWTFGVTVADINGDDLDDIYLTKVSALADQSGGNLLYINQGVNAEGIPSFIERSEDFGLNLNGYGTHSVFFDVEGDGDLDMYLLQHSVHPNRSYGKGSLRAEYDNESGDKLFENQSGRFVDISSSSGIFQGKVGYGLGVSIGDLNADNLLDVYVGNDFFESDYLYLNQGNKSFIEVNNKPASPLGHTSHFSMGNTFVDINNDGLLDIVSLDMLPPDLREYKKSGHEDPYDTYLFYLKNGYSPQYMQNTLHLNMGSSRFSEVGYLNGIAATEWSWSVLAEDFDLDGFSDLFVSNGIPAATNDMDFISFASSDIIQNQMVTGDYDELDKILSRLPDKKVPNEFFRNIGDGRMERVTESWQETIPTYSAGSVAADLDGDGDLDIVTNNTGEQPEILENLANTKGHSWLKIEFSSIERNSKGLYAKVKIYLGEKVITKVNNPYSYLSTGPSEIIVGLGNVKQVDSLTVDWPNGLTQTIRNVEVNQKVVITQEEASQKVAKDISHFESNFFPFLHKEEPTLEFAREPLRPITKGHEGPALAVGDLDSDGNEDVIIGGGKRQSSKVFYSKGTGEFTSISLSGDSIAEVVDCELIDIDGDGDKDFITVAGGNEYVNQAFLEPMVYLNNDGVLRLTSDRLIDVDKTQYSDMVSLDVEGDGDIDIFLAMDGVPGEYGMSGENSLLLNDGSGNFTSSADLLVADEIKFGLVQNVFTKDLDGDESEDLVLVGNWMPITICYNSQGKFEKCSTIEGSEGWWESVAVSDFDKDGDYDIIAGNWGLNSRLQASTKEPMTLYRYDFDQNGKVDPILTYHYQGVETTLASKDELTKQIPLINKRFLSYESFAKASVEELLGKDNLRKSEKLYVKELASCFFVNQGNDQFEKVELPIMVQYSSIHAIHVDDFNNDGWDDVLLAGNTHHISTQLGRLDASHGAVLLNDQKGFFEAKIPKPDLGGQVRDIDSVIVDGEEYLIVTKNGEQPIFFKKSDLLDE